MRILLQDDTKLKKNENFFLLWAELLFDGVKYHPRQTKTHICLSNIKKIANYTLLLLLLLLLMLLLLLKLLLLLMLILLLLLSSGLFLFCFECLFHVRPSDFCCLFKGRHDMGA